MEQIMLADNDEFLHTPDASPIWQENYFFVGRDDSTDTVVYLHLERMPSRNEVEAKAFVEVAGNRCSAVVAHHGDDCFDIPGVSVAVEQPFRRWRVAVNLAGEDDGPGGWAAERTDGPTRFGFDLEVTSTLAPTDWGPAAAALGRPDVILDHYEVPCVWSGTVWCGDSQVSATGLLVRDHSWGPRDLATFDLAFWTPMVFADATMFISAVTMLVGGRHVGFTFIDTGSGAVLFEQPWVRVAGFPERRGYGSASWRCLGADREERVEIDVASHVPVRYPRMGDGHYFNDALGVATWGAHQGLGIIELNRH
ncbi:hypothetical protein MHOL44478_00675 [Mycobacterium holsaticum DSM 44478]|nr:hypothetical protein [Mycolicibacterium holsaticum DSM 44478 = JCM 12374]